MLSRRLKTIGIPSLIAEAAESHLIRELDPGPRPRRSVVAAKAAKLARRLRRAHHDEYFALPEPVGRDTFVEACRRVLGNLDREVAIVGMGRRLGAARRRPSRITHAWVSVGGKDSVALTDRGRALVRAQVSTVERGETLVVHNHPPAWWRIILAEIVGWEPLPSLLDREEAGRRHRDSLREFLQHYHDGFYRFYLVDQGEAEEFVLPPLETALRGLARLSSLSPPDQMSWLLSVMRQAPW